MHRHLNLKDVNVQTTTISAQGMESNCGTCLQDPGLWDGGFKRGFVVTPF